MKHPLFPNSPGIYLFKDKAGTILYIGKAKSIRKRVAAYFKPTHDWKIAALIADHATIESIVTTTEMEALLLEAQLINEHKPRYNTLLKEGQPYLYILLTKGALPTLKIVRTKREKGTYFGPFLQKTQARSAYRYLVNTFRLAVCTTKIDSGCLDFHLGRCAGNCKNNFDLHDYLFRLTLATDVLKKDHRTFLKRIQHKIDAYNQQMAFEKSQHLHAYKENFDAIFTALKARLAPKKFDAAIEAITMPSLSVTKDEPSLGIQLQQFLKLDNPVSTIDCFDVSHFQGASLVGSCVRFKDGKPDKNSFRRFIIKTLTKQDDYAALQEIISRRYRDPLNLPDVVVIDGGKGQLNAAKKVLPVHVPCISLAKREETIFSTYYPEGIQITTSSDIGRFLIALRDYAHHFAVTFHRTKRIKGVR